MPAISIDEILAHIPHRYPFLLVDRVVQVEPGKSLEAIKNVTTNEPFFQGHFPEQPVMPGVMMIEALAQAAGLLILCTDTSLSKEKHNFFLAGVNNARFKRVVQPGDQLKLYAEIVRQKATLWKFNCQAMVGDETACSAEILNVITPK